MTGSREPNDRPLVDGRASAGDAPTSAPDLSSIVSRRRFLATAAAAAALAACDRAERITGVAGAPGSPEGALLPKPSASGIEHVVVVMMENRSFDHLLGWTPGADGRQAGLTYADAAGVAHPTWPLAPDYQGCSHPDPDHSYAGGRVELDGGRCDGWLRAGANDVYAIGFYTQPDLAFLGQAVPRWTTCDRYFSAIMAATYPNRIYQHAGQTDRITNSTQLSTLPTIWDRLAAAGLTGRYYYSDLPFLALWGQKYLSIGRPFAAFLADCAAGTLPNVSFVDPRFVHDSSGTSGDDHPHADLRAGESFMSLVYAAVTQGPAWGSTLLVFNYDEWGGFFDHVPPPTAPIPRADRAAGNADGRLGFRTPALLVGPWAPRGAVAHTRFDHTSVLRLIEWRWRLPTLSVRDATARNLAEALDFGRPSLAAPQFAVPGGPFGAPCAVGGTGADSDLAQLRSLAVQFGWPVYA